MALKPEVKAPEKQVPYIRNPAGMKIEAKGIRFKYDRDDENEILKGVSITCDFSPDTPLMLTEMPTEIIINVRIRVFIL